MTTPPPNPNAARCWSCNYQLRAIQSSQCPECGHPFDRAIPSTMNFGPEIGLVGRWMISPPGRGLILLAAIGCALVWATVRRPVEGWTFSLVDLKFYADVRHWGSRWAGTTAIDAMYVIGLMTGALAGVGSMARVALRVAAISRYRPPVRPRTGMGKRTAALCLALLGVFLGIGFGWPYRLGQRWVADVVKPVAINGVANYPAPRQEQPKNLNAAQALTVIRSAVLQGSTPRMRIGGVKLLMETRPNGAPPIRSILMQAIDAEHNVEVRAMEIRLLGINRESYSGPYLAALLDDPQPQIREAAADAIGIWRSPAFPLGQESRWPSCRIDSDPAIDLDVRSVNTIVTQSPPAFTRERLERMMTAGETASEREAAGRALLSWPPEQYRLRYAEWGVFMADAIGNLSVVRAQLDEVPPFVHRVGDPARELESRITLDTTPVWKPVIHLTTDRPMVVDLEVCLRDGWPWVVYPRVDDLAMIPRPNARRPQVGARWAPSTAPAFPEYQMFDPPEMASLGDLREGYPWLATKHRAYPWKNWNPPSTQASTTMHAVGGVGVRWQSLIVNPQKLDWMKPPQVQTDPRFSWWTRLREVDCSWVSSRGESERFLYYDGPTSRKAAVNVILNGTRVEITPRDAFPYQVSHPGAWDSHRPGLFIEVVGKMVKTLPAENLHWPTALETATAIAKSADDAEAACREILLRRGLNQSEAAGLLDCWRHAFFETPGRRFLTFMSDLDYDDACPMHMRPLPTQRVRVGIIWTEFK